MKLDNVQLFTSIDVDNMLGEIQGLPEQLLKAWQTAEALPLPPKKDYSSVIVAGMGGSAIGADILSAYTFSKCKVPFYVLRGYQLPAWAAGEDILVICSSHSGNTEETNAVFLEAIEKKCSIITISTGGKLLEQAKSNGITSWTFEHVGQPRAAVGFSFGLLLNLFSRLGFIPEQADALQTVVNEMQSFRAEIETDLPAVKNLAKRIAGQAIERVPVVIGAEHMEPVARRWKTQINENSKALAQFEFIPEADHNTLAGNVYPEEMLYKTYAIFLDSKRYHERNQKRFELTVKEFMVAGMCVDMIKGKGSTKLTEIWNAVLLGDYVSFYLAMAYEVDPTAIEVLNSLKAAMRD